MSLDSWDLFFIPLLGVGIPANIFCIGFTLKFHKKFYGLGLFILNLALSDLILHVTAFYFKYNRKLNLSNALTCKLFNSLDIAALHNSCFTLTIVAYYRLKILRGAQITSGGNSWSCHNQNCRHDVLLCLACWALSLAITLPFGLSMTFDENFGRCNSTFSIEVHTIYSVFVFVSTWVIPAITTAIIYGNILYKISSLPTTLTNDRSCTNNNDTDKIDNESIENNNNNNNNNNSLGNIRHINLFKFLSIFTIVYWLFHLPFWLSYMTRTFDLQVFPDNVHQFAIALSYLNAAIDPFLYTLLTRKRALKAVMCFFKFICFTVFCELLYLVACSDIYDEYSESELANPENVLGNRDIMQRTAEKGNREQPQKCENNDVVNAKQLPKKETPKSSSHIATNEQFSNDDVFEDATAESSEKIIECKKRKRYSVIVKPELSSGENNIRKKKISLQITGNLPSPAGSGDKKSSKKISLQLLLTPQQQSDKLVQNHTGIPTASTNL